MTLKFGFMTHSEFIYIYIYIYNFFKTQHILLGIRSQSWRLDTCSNFHTQVI
ncbi:MAG: hypothetical protein N7Q72_04115 [Spiroplasma sp. Tabriz.8]|nr:hypothetical protein [Spiroplasma sp. Tabriz.8]